MLTELKKLTGDFSTQPLTRGREMRELLEHSPAEFCAAAIEILSSEEAERVKRYLIALLWTNNLLIPCLTDPSTSPDIAEGIAALARRVDPQLPAKLVAFVLERTDVEPPECLERILGLLKSMPDAASFRPLLTPLLHHPNPRLRSKVALLAGEGNRNRTWFERRMLEEDPRVRANVIESAGTAVTNDMRLLFRSAAADSNNRVVGNALIALYRLGDAQAIANIHELVSHPEPTFRATGVWAMGETGDTRFLPVLARILKDPNETIKAATFRAIRKLRGRDSIEGQTLAIRILSEPSICESAMKITFGVASECKPVLGIVPTSVRILANGEFVYRYSVAEQECPRRVSAAFLLPRGGTQKRDAAEHYREALERCFDCRRTGDAWLLSQHSPSARPGGAARTQTLFGVRIDTTENSRIRSIPNLVELHTAFESREPTTRGFTPAFLALCQELRPSRVSAHMFLIHPETAQETETSELVQAAKESRVSVHAVCREHAPWVREICQSTNGFYAIGENVQEVLPALYRGLSHRYLATIIPDGDIDRVQVAVRSADSFGESLVVEVNG